MGIKGWNTPLSHPLQVTDFVERGCPFKQRFGKAKKPSAFVRILVRGCFYGDNECNKLLHVNVRSRTDRSLH
jgi:hypothetical protein